MELLKVLLLYSYNNVSAIFYKNFKKRDYLKRLLSVVISIINNLYELKMNEYIDYFLIYLHTEKSILHEGYNIRNKV